MHSFVPPKLDNIEKEKDPKKIHEIYDNIVLGNQIDNEHKEEIELNDENHNKNILEEDIHDSNFNNIINSFNEVKELIINNNDNKIIFDKFEEINNSLNILINDKKTNEEKIDSIYSNINSIDNKIDNILKENFFNNDIIIELDKLIDYGRILEKTINDIENKNKKLLKEMLKKILNKEITEHSNQIILNSFNLIYEKIKEAHKIEIFINPYNFDELEKNLKNLHIEQDIVFLKKDKNINIGNMLILSDKGNFDNNLNDKLELIIKSIL